MHNQSLSQTKKDLPIWPAVIIGRKRVKQAVGSEDMSLPELRHSCLGRCREVQGERRGSPLKDQPEELIPLGGISESMTRGMIPPLAPCRVARGRAGPCSWSTRFMMIGGAQIRGGNGLRLATSGNPWNSNGQDCPKSSQKRKDQKCEMMWLPSYLVYFVEIQEVV